MQMVLKTTLNSKQKKYPAGRNTRSLRVTYSISPKANRTCIGQTKTKPPGYGLSKSLPAKRFPLKRFPAGAHDKSIIGHQGYRFRFRWCYRRFRMREARGMAWPAENDRRPERILMEKS